MPKRRDPSDYPHHGTYVASRRFALLGAYERVWIVVTRGSERVLVRYKGSFGKRAYATVYRYDSKNRLRVRRVPEMACTLGSLKFDPVADTLTVDVCAAFLWGRPTREVTFVRVR